MTDYTATTHRVINLAGVTWTENGRQATFRATRPGYGVQVTATGELVSRDGVTPSVWRLKSAASTIAQYPPTHWATIPANTPAS